MFLLFRVFVFFVFVFVSSRALNVARFPIFTADQTRCRGRGPGRAAVCRADEKQIEYKSRRMRRELATTPAWVLSRGIEMAKTENRDFVSLFFGIFQHPAILYCDATLRGTKIP